MPDSPTPLRLEALLAHTGWVRALAHRLVVDPGRAEDVAQQTWVAALEHPPRTLVSPKAWLAAVLRNVARETRRGDERRSRRERASARSGTLPSAEELVERAEQQKRVVQAVLDLPEPYRGTLLLRFFEDRSSEEIAAELGLPGSTVRNRLKRGLDLLRERFDHEEGGDRAAWRLALLPLVRPGAAHTALASGTAAAAKGGLAMGVQLSLTASFVAVIGLGTWTLPDGESTPESLRALEPAASALEAAGASLEARAPVPAFPASQDEQHTLSGRVTDAAGNPVQGASVLVGGQPNPFADPPDVAILLRIGASPEGGVAYWVNQSAERLEERGIVLGKRLTTDAEGRYEASFPDARRVYAALLRTTGIAPIDWPGGEGHHTLSGAWNATPAKGVDFVARIIPTAELTVWVTDQSTASRLDTFAGQVTGLGGQSVRIETTTGLFEQTVELHSTPADAHIAISEPEWAKVERNVLLTPGAHARVELLVTSGAGFAGQVVDALGNPLEGAIVVWGDQLQIRGGNYFRAFNANHVSGSVRTDSSGQYRLPGTAQQVTVWHASHSPKTVARTLAATIQLGPRGSIRGLVLDEAGAPVAGAVVALDRAREVATDAEGRYLFEGVEAGVHGIRLAEGRWVGVVVKEGAVVDIGDPPVVDTVEMRILSNGVLFPFERGGLLLGTSRPTFSLHEWGAKEGIATVRRIRPGRFVLFTRSTVARVDLTGPDATLELGTASLTVVSTTAKQLFLHPVSDDPLVAFWGKRMSREVPDTGKVTWSPLQAGRYTLGVLDERGGKARVVKEVEVGTEDILLELD